MKQKRYSLVMFVMCVFMQIFGGIRASAAGSAGVVINEVAWAGSADSANDEWIELYNNGGVAVDLTGWVINDDQGQSVYALSGTIASHGFYVIEDAETSVQPATANLIVNLSLANSGDSLVLFDGSGQVIDAVNGSGGAWFAGNSTTHAAMERLDAAVSGDNAANWVTSNGNGSSAVSSAGSPINGTPGLVNSQSQIQTAQAVLTMNVSNSSPNVGDVVTVDFAVASVNDLFSYGIDLQYDPAVLSYISSSAGNFLNEGGAVATSFQAGLENGQSGTLIIAEGRTQTIKSGVDGSGVLAHASFTVIGGAGTNSQLQFGSASFLADVAGDLSVTMSGSEVAPQSGAVAVVTGASAVAGSARYTIDLQWAAPAGGADKYRIYRKNAHGNFVMLGETALLNFTDSDAVSAGGKIIPELNYSYQIKAVKGSTESAGVDVQAKEVRGLKGDNDRSDRVDGRDLDNLARHFAQTDADNGFSVLADTTYDGQIDGSDLIDLGVNFAKVY